MVVISQVIQNCSLPPGRGQGRRATYPFSQCEIGDGFSVDLEESGSEASLRSAVSQHTRRNPPQKWTCARVTPRKFLVVRVA